RCTAESRARVRGRSWARSAVTVHRVGGRGQGSTDGFGPRAQRGRAALRFSGRRCQSRRLPVRRIANLAVCLWVTAATAQPPGPATFFSKYPGVPACTGPQPACTYCHVSPPTRNAFGMSVEARLYPFAPRPLSDSDYAMGLPAALSAVEGEDSDGDG